MTTTEKKEILNTYAAETSRLVTKMLPIINRAYDNLAMVDLLMGLPIAFDFNEVDLDKIKEEVEAAGNEFSVENLSIGGHITRDSDRGNPDRLVVFITFNKDINQTWQNFFEILLSDPAYTNVMAFTYIHEAMHILMRHYDFYLNQNMERIISDIRPDLEQDMRLELLNHAYDYWINAYLIEQANSSTPIGAWRDNNCPYLYDKNLSPDSKTQVEIIEILARDAKINKIPITGTSGQSIGTLTSITINGNTSQTFSMDGQHQITTQDIPQAAEQEVSEILSTTRNELLNKTRGEGHSGAFEKLGVDYSVPTDWFKALKGSIFSIVQHHTNNYDLTWARPRKKFMHLYPRPGFIYKEKNLAAIVSIDQSGSMSKDDLEKINYVVTKLAQKTDFVEILLHDTSVAERKRFTKKSFRGIQEFVTNRVACGGTSHREVFQIVDEIKNEKRSMKFIYLSFSDNWSDIEQVYDDNIFRGVNAYWITTDENKTVTVPGMQISLENGLL
jgi:hypothetical protein